MAITINDVAIKAGVSASTVSLVLNNKGNISKETIQKVYDAVEITGYNTKKYSHKNKDSKKSKKVGILYKNRFNGQNIVSHPFYGQIMEGIEESLREHNFHIFFKTLTGKYESDSIEVKKLIQDQELAGLILISYEISKEVIMDIHNNSIPLVLIDNEIWDENIDCVLSDNINGARRMVSHLIDNGHKKIAFISGPFSHTCLKERYIGYRQALDEAGIDVNKDYISIQEKSHFFVDEGYQSLKEIFNNNTDKPTAVFTSVDALAIGAIKALQEMGFSVPKDVSVAGFDDIVMSAHTIPPLSTVRIFKREMGNLAGKRLYELINGSNIKAVKLIVSVEMILRESTS